MKNITLILLMVLTSAVYGQSQDKKKSNIEEAQKYVYFLDNGFEKIDLLQTGEVKRSFFTIGTPMLVIAKKDDPSRRNIISSYTVLVKPSIPAEQPRDFKMSSALFTPGASQMISVQKPESIIQFLEVKLTVVDALPKEQSQSKFKNEFGTLPVSFYLYLR